MSYLYGVGFPGAPQLENPLEIAKQVVNNVVTRSPEKWVNVSADGARKQQARIAMLAAAAQGQGSGVSASTAVEAIPPEVAAGSTNEELLALIMALSGNKDEGKDEGLIMGMPVAVAAALALGVGFLLMQKKG